MDELPLELQAFPSLLDAQPLPARELFQYSLCLMMVETGKMKLVQLMPGDSVILCIFETTAGEVFTIPRLPFSHETEVETVNALREILVDEELL